MMESGEVIGSKRSSPYKGTQSLGSQVVWVIWGRTEVGGPRVNQVVYVVWDGTEVRWFKGDIYDVIDVR